VDLNVQGQRSVVNAFASGKVEVNGKFELDEPYDYLLTGDLDTEFGTFAIQGIGGPEALSSTGTLLAGSYNFSAMLARSTGGETFSFDEFLQFNLALTPASVVPEPGSLVLFGGILGAAGWWYHGRRRRLPG
jgi:hypothetical protein